MIAPDALAESPTLTPLIVNLEPLANEDNPNSAAVTDTVSPLTVTAIFAPLSLASVNSLPFLKTLVPEIS